MSYTFSVKQLIIFPRSFFVWLLEISKKKKEQMAQQEISQSSKQKAPLSPHRTSPPFQFHYFPVEGQMKRTQLSSSHSVQMLPMFALLF